MRAIIRSAVGLGLPLMVGVVVLPLSLTGMVTVGLQQAAAFAWDIPPELVPVFQEAGRVEGVPWTILAGVASVATDFGRHGPDGVARGETLGTSIYPEVVPSLAGGMFLIDPMAAPLSPVGAQDVRAATGWLAATLARLAGAASRPVTPLDALRWWTGVVASLPLHIDAIAGQAVGTPAPAPPGDNPVRVFGSLVLPRLGAPVTSANLDAIDAWAAGEGSCAAFNPLDTTQPEPGATPFNTLPGGGHVWNYPSLDTGVRATVETLLNGLYQPILTTLQASGGVAAVAAAVGHSPWGTVSFGNPSYAGRQCGDTPRLSPAGTAAPPVPTVTGPDAVAATIVARAASYQSLWDHRGAIGPGP